MKVPEGHGKELARFVKPGQILHILTDGCIFVEIYHIMRAGPSGHAHLDKTLEGISEDSLAEIEAEMKHSGYECENEIFWRRE